MRHMVSVDGGPISPGLGASRLHSSGRLYSPGGCGCAALAALFLTVGMALLTISLCMAVLAVAGLVFAVALTIREVRGIRAGAAVRFWPSVAIGALYVACISCLGFLIWFWCFA